MAANTISEWESVEVTNDPRWAAVKKVVGSTCFVRAAFLSDFLLYIAGQELSGHTEEITEQKIGHRVYKRSELYSPADDNIVRVSARQLRLRLHEFYETEGKEEAWVIEIPKGRYVPVFRNRRESEIQTDNTPTRSRYLAVITWSTAAAVLAIGLIIIWPRISRVNAVPHPASRPPNLITSIFRGASQPVQVVMSDEALVLMETMLGHGITLEEYSNQSYRQVPPSLQGNDKAEHIWHVLETRQIINVGDAGVSTRIRDSLAQLDPGPIVEIQSAQNMRPRDFLSGNFILLGESSSNPWGEMFKVNRFNFQFSSDLIHFPRRILNLHPKPGEQQYYAADVAHNVSYARIAYIPNLTNTGRVLLIGGTTMEGTEAATDFCLQPDSVRELHRDLGIDDGKQLPPFEVLLATSSTGGTGVGAHVVSVRNMSDGSSR
jgi:hypothetical protein